MNAITNMFKNQDVFGGYGVADFDIDVAPLQYVGTDNEVYSASKKVIFRTDTMAELGIHGDKYQAVAPKKLIQSAREIILRSDLDCSGIKEQIRTSHNGSRTFVKYDLPNHTYTTPDGDTASLSLLAITSFDSSWPFMISVAATQFACTNLQVFTRGEVALYRSLHTKGLDIERGSRIIVKALDAFNTERDLWAKYYTTDITSEEAFNIFVNAAGATKAVEELRSEMPNITASGILNNMKRENKALNHLVKAFISYRRRFGSTLWAVYNALTDWSTHGEGLNTKQRENIAHVQHSRHSKVREVISTESAFRLAA